MKNFKTFSLAILMLINFVSMAQEKTITGIVSDNLGPLPGASVVVKNTNRGTQTDFDGKYSIKASKGETLVFSYVGYNSKSIKVGKKNTINVELDGIQNLSEVVVTGYDAYSDKEIKKAMKGKVAGIQVGANNSSIQIRGNASLKLEERNHIINPSKRHHCYE